MVRYIAGDIGGTNSRLHLIETTESSGISQEHTVAEETYPSQKYSSMAVVIQLFLDKHVKDRRHWPKAMCLAVAGPVQNNKSQITNVSWLIDGDELQRTLNIPTVSIINDFVGVGYGLLALERKDVIPLNDVELTPGGPKACLGAGTGLGETYLTSNGSEYEVWGSEGGHTDFAPRNETEFQLLQFLKEKDRVPRVSVERVVSGMGIPRIYEYFCSVYPQEVQESVQQRLRNEDPGLVIAQSAQNNKCNLCRRTMDLFVQCYGAEAGNLALKTLPSGGLYIAGGIAPKILWAIQHDNQFWNNFIAKGRMQALLQKLPVYIVINPHVGLLGAKVVSRRLLRKQGFSCGDGEQDQITVPTTKPPKLDEEYEPAHIPDKCLASPLVRAPAKRVSTMVPTTSTTAATLDPNVLNRHLTRAALLGGVVASIVTITTLTLLSRVTRKQ